MRTPGPGYAASSQDADRNRTRVPRRRQTGFSSGLASAVGAGRRGDAASPDPDGFETATREPGAADKTDMRSCWCASIAAAVLVIGGCTDERPFPIEVPSASIPQFVRVRTTGNGPVVRVALEDYVRGAILSEFAPPSGDPAEIERMLEVQAIIARTYAAAHIARHQREGYDLCSTTHCQLYQPSRIRTSSWAPLADEAAAHTAGMVLWYGSGPAST